MTLTEAQSLIDEYDIRYILAQFVDIHGVAKTKSVPAHCLENVIEDGAGFAGFAVWGLGMEPHGPDFMARGDLDTLTPVLGERQNGQNKSPVASLLTMDLLRYG